MVRGERLPIRCVVMSQQMLPGSPLPFFSLHEQACLVLIHPIPHDVVGRPGELMAYCFDGNDFVRLHTLSFIVPLYHFVMPSGRMGRFKVCPGEIFIAVSAIAIAGDFPSPPHSWAECGNSFSANSLAALIISFCSSVRSKFTSFLGYSW